MSNSHIITSIKFLYLLFCVGIILTAGRIYVGQLVLTDLLDQALFVFLVLAIHKKQSRTAAVTAMLICLATVIDNGAMVLGHEAVFSTASHTLELALPYLIQAVISAVLFSICISWSFKFHSLNESETNWSNVAGMISVIVAYLLTLIVITSVVGEAILGFSENEMDKFSSMIAFVIIVTGGWRILPGTRSLPTIVPVESYAEIDEEPSNDPRNNLIVISGVFLGIVISSWMTGAPYSTVVMLVMMIGCIAWHDFRRLQSSKRK